MSRAGAALAWDREAELQAWPQDEVQNTTPANEEKLISDVAQARKKILALDNDWDGDGATSYSEETFERAVTFLTMHSDYLKQYGLALPVPHIGAGPDGSIDLHWKRPTWELLVNIPADESKMAPFYGDNYGVQKIKGSVDPKTCNMGLAAWLMN